MALKSSLTSVWKSMSRVEGKRAFASSAAAHPHASGNGGMQEYMKGELAPIYMVMGMVMAAVSFGTHTAKQQLMHAPGVSVSKKKRERLGEVEDPDAAISSADKFVNKSFFRKVAHIQDTNRTLHDPVHPDPFTRPRSAETLKTAGVDPSRRYP